MSSALSGAAPAERVTLQRKFKLQFAVEPEIMEKLARVRSLLSIKHPAGMRFEIIFDILLQEYLDRHGPEEKISRRVARRVRAEKKRKKLENNDNPNDGNREPSQGANAPGGIIKRIRLPQAIPKHTRYIPQHIRDEVLKRDGGRCTFVGDDGKRCDSHWNLEIDHIIPYARGGDNSPGNLRLLCARHNRLEAERIYGREFMNRHHR